MKCSFAQLVLFAAGFVCRATAALSGWDEVQLQLLETCPTQLRWYNVEARPYVIAGPAPRYQWGRHADLVQLSPGQELILHLPAAAWLRIVSRSDALTPDDLQVGVSTDGRAFADCTLLKTTDPRSWLVGLPLNDSSVVRIVHTARTQAQIAFELYFSQEWPPNTLLPYRDVVSLPGNAIRLRAKDEPVLQRAWLIKPEEGVQLTLTGPAHLQLVARVAWPDTEPFNQQMVVLDVRLDDMASVPLLLVPELEGQRGINLLRAYGPISKRMTGFVGIPDGKHTLRIKPSVPVYLSVFRQPTRPFLLPSLNAPERHADAVAPFRVPPPLHDVAAVLISSPEKLTPSALVELEQSAWLFSVDNQVQDSGGQAADLLGRISQIHRDYPVARRTAARMRWHRTAYREVLPAFTSLRMSLQRAYFVHQSLAPVFGGEQCVAVVNPTTQQVCESLADGHFVPVPGSQTNALHYALPARSFDSTLRISTLVPEHTQADFFVQFDDEAPIRVVVEDRRLTPAPRPDVSRAVATLRVIEQEAQLPRDQEPTLAFGEFDLPLPVAVPGVLELPLVKTVQTVRVYQETPSVPVKVSVAYRAAKPFELCEADYLALLQQVGSNEAIGLLTNPLNVKSNRPGCITLLGNHLLPLFRVLRSHYADFCKGVDSTAMRETSGTRLSEAAAFELKSKAEALETDGHYIEAIERWNRIFWLGGPEERLVATLRIMGLLQLLGEDYMASQYARFALCTTSPTQMPNAAVEFLVQNASAAGDPEQLERLRAFEFVRCPCNRHLAELVEAFALNGRYEAVLTAGLLLAPDQRPVEPMLIAAVQLNWWQSFDQLLKLLPSDEEKSFWRAQKDLAFFRFADAERSLERAGALGADMLRALRDGMRIRKGLGAERFADRVEALFEWEQWQAHHPGPKAWFDAGDVVVECAGGALVFNCELNSYLRCYRAEPGAPVKLAFLGPARLQIETRPVICAASDKPVDDWVEFTEYGITHRVPVTQCVPNPALQLVSDSNALVGVKTTATLEFGAGLHEIDVRLVSNTCLVRVLREQPALPLRVLPILNLHQVDLVLGTNRKLDQLGQSSRIECPKGVWIVPEKLAQPTLLRPTIATNHVPLPESMSGAALTPVQRLRILLRTRSDAANEPTFDTAVLGALPVAEQWLAVRRWKRFELFSQWAALPEVERANYLIATRQIRELLDTKIPQDVAQRINVLLQVSELFPAWRLEAQILAELAAAETRLQPGCKELLDRMRRQTTWMPLPVTPQSAGLRAIQFPCDFPQHPAWRVRHALLQPAGSNKLTLGAQSVFSAAATLKRRVEFDLEVELAKAGLSPLAPVTVIFELDNAEVQHLCLTPAQQTIRTNLVMGEGQHLLRAWIEEPIVNQFVRIQLAARQIESAEQLGANILAEGAIENRFFNIATAAQPVRFYWNGPALVRVDRWDNGALQHQLRFLSEGEQCVELYPPPGQPEALYKFFVLALASNKVHAQPALATRQLEPVPPPQFEPPPTVTPAQMQLTDYYPLGGQEDGTWTAGFMYARRRPFELDRKLDAVVNEFVEVNAAHRKLALDESLWYDTEALARAHLCGDVTLGAEQRIERRPVDSCIDWLWLGEAYVGMAGGRQQDIQAAVHTEFEIGPRLDLSRKLEFYPSVTLFGRYMTLTPGRAAEYEYVDQDLYTRFKHAHRWGLIAGSQLNYRPWLDTLVRCNIELASNEDFTPDSCGLRFTWTQLIGPVRGNLGLRLKQFFSDADRSAGSFVQSAAVGLFCERWLTGQHRVEFGFEYRHDWPGSLSSYFLVVRCDFGRGRGYRDHGPRESPFGDLRSSRLPAAFNNKLEPGLPGNSMP